MKICFYPNMKMYIPDTIEVIDVDGIERRISSRNTKFFGVEYISLQPYGPPDNKWGQMYEHVWKDPFQCSNLTDEELIQIMGKDNLILTVQNENLWLQTYE